MNKSINTSEESLKVFAPAKINLHLEVLGLRGDGFHELAMVMQSIDLVDHIFIKRRSDSEIVLSSNDPNLSMGDDNLIMKAARLIRSRSERIELGASIHLIKNIPIGAGLAGGSSDAAATLCGLNSLWELDFTSKELEVISSELGSDVPFCISGGIQLCFGRGEILEPLQKSPEDMAVVLVKDPLVEVSTPWAYSRYKQINFNKYLTNESDFQKRRQLLRESSWLDSINQLNPPTLRNDLQNVIAPAIPAVRNGLKFLSSLEGSLSIAMSGSGPSCFALFSDYKAAKSALDQNKGNLKKYGLKAWCCSFQSKEVLS